MRTPHFEPHGPDKVILSRADFEDMLDTLAYDAAKSRVEETVPADMVAQILSGASPVKVWREHRGLTQKALAEQAGVAQATIAEIETGRKTGSVHMLKAIAAALMVDLGDIVTS